MGKKVLSLLFMLIILLSGSCPDYQQNLERNCL